MLAYLARRIAYALPILFGVNVLLFILFFFINSPDDMARTYLGDKGVTKQQVDDWKKEHGYDLPRLYNSAETFPRSVTRTIFWQKNMRLFVFDFGRSDLNGARIGREVRTRIPFSLAITAPAFVIALLVDIIIAMLIAYYRATYIDTVALVLCVLFMSVSPLLYIIFAQYVFSTLLHLAPASGFDAHPLYMWKFLALPIFIGVIAGLGSDIRYYRTIFLEEVNRDYVRTARAKGLGEGAVLFKHVLKNAMIPILTSVVVSIPFLITGSLLLESFFGIPGLGNYLIEAIWKQDFAVVRAMVFLGACLYIGALILVDVSYTLVDPRVRLE